MIPKFGSIPLSSKTNAPKEEEEDNDFCIIKNNEVEYDDINPDEINVGYPDFSDDEDLCAPLPTPIRSNPPISNNNKPINKNLYNKPKQPLPQMPSNVQMNNNKKPIPPSKPKIEQNIQPKPLIPKSKPQIPQSKPQVPKNKQNNYQKQQNPPKQGEKIPKGKNPPKKGQDPYYGVEVVYPYQVASYPLTYVPQGTYYQPQTVPLYEPQISTSPVVVYPSGYPTYGAIIDDGLY